MRTDFLKGRYGAIVFEDVQVLKVATHASGRPVTTDVGFVRRHAEINQFVLQHVDLVLHAEPHPEVKIGDLGQAAAIVTTLVVTLSADQDARVTERIALAEEAIQPGMAAAIGLSEDVEVEVRLIPQRRTLFVDDLCVGKDRAQLGTRIQKLHLSPQLVRLPNIVRVVHSNELS